MKLMLLISLLALNLSARAESYVEEIQRESGLRAGRYKVTKESPRKCFTGALTFEEAGPNAVAIRIGGAVLIDAIGRGANGTLEDDSKLCPPVRTSEPVRAGHLGGTKTMKCDDDETVYKWAYSIDVTPEGFTYTLVRNDGTMKCTLIRQSPR